MKLRSNYVYVCVRIYSCGGVLLEAVPFLAAPCPVRPRGIKLPRRAGWPTGASSSIGALGKAGLLYGAAVPPAPRLHTMSFRLVNSLLFFHEGSCRQRSAPRNFERAGFAAGRALSGVALVLSTFGATPLHDTSGYATHRTHEAFRRERSIARRSGRPGESGSG